MQFTRTYTCTMCKCNCWCTNIHVPLTYLRVPVDFCVVMSSRTFFFLITFMQDSKWVDQYRTIRLTLLQGMCMVWVCGLFGVLIVFADPIISLQATPLYIVLYMFNICMCTVCILCSKKTVWKTWWFMIQVLVPRCMRYVFCLASGVMYTVLHVYAWCTWCLATNEFHMY